jgi:RNA polymerase sigma factor (sigma-70 family)
LGLLLEITKMHSEDGFIIHKCLNGEPEAFGLLVDKYKASIYAFVYAKLHNFHDAEDVTQETFIKAYRKLRDLRKWDSFLAWLYCIASDKCRKFVRSQSSRPDSEFIEDQKFKDNWTDTNSENAYESLHDALDSLPEIYREVLTLHYLGGMSTNQIANFLRVSPESIRQRLSRARTQLKEEVLAIMSGTLTQHRLQANFTFRVVEILKKIKIQPTSAIKGLPWGLSLGTGLIFTFLMFGQNIQLNLPDIAMGLPLPSEMKVLKIGEIPVDAVKVSTITSIGSKGDGKGVAPDPKGQEYAFFMAPQGEGGEWEKRTDIPTAVVWHSVTEINGNIYVIGGWSTRSVNEEYDPKLDKWNKKANMPKGRYAHSATAVNGKIYVIGGGDNNGQASSSVQEYNPETDTWTDKSDMPTPKFAHSAAAINGNIYVLGGESAPFSIFVYDPKIDKWQVLKDIPPEFAFSGSASIAVENKIYILGGLNPNNWNWVQLLIYDTKTQSWEKGSNIPTQRYNPTAGLIDGTIYLIGGCTLAFTPLSAVEAYNIENNSWSAKADMPTKRSFLGCSVIDNKIFVPGGTVVGDNGVGSTVNEAYIPDNIDSKSVDPNGKLPKTWGTLKAK